MGFIQFFFDHIALGDTSVITATKMVTQIFTVFLVVSLRKFEINKQMDPIYKETWVLKVCTWTTSLFSALEF